MENFCYWQENSPTKSYFNYTEKICLLRLNEYKIQKENGTANKVNIICPYKDKKNALSCSDYLLIKDMK